MKYVSPLLSDARGKLGGTIFARNPSGIYTRPKVTPSQPRTPSQTSNRAGFAALASAWKTLTAAQRTGWNAAAPGVTLHDSLGNTYTPSGMQLYISCNRNLQLAGMPGVSTAPAARPAFQPVEPLTATMLTSSGTLSTLKLTVPASLLPSQNAVIISATGPLSPGINFVARHLYRRLAPPFAVAYPTAQTATGAITSGFAAEAGAPQVLVNQNPSPGGYLARVQLQFGTAPAAGQPVQLCIATGAAPTWSVTPFATVKVAATTAVQTFLAGRDFPPLYVPAGQYFSTYTASGEGPAVNSPDGVNLLWYYTNTLPTGPVTFNYSGYCAAFVCYTQQAGSPATFNLLKPYTALFSGPFLASQIGLRIQLVDPTTGYASAVATLLQTVTGT